MINNRPVCDQGWDDVDAGVLCRMLGFGSGEATTGSHFGEVTTSFIMTDVRCAGDEETILDCPHSLLVSCSPDQAAGVVCRDRQMMAEAGQMYPCQLVFALHCTQYRGHQECHHLYTCKLLTQSKDYLIYRAESFCLKAEGRNTLYKSTHERNTPS